MSEDLAVSSYAEHSIEAWGLTFILIRFQKGGRTSDACSERPSETTVTSSTACGLISCL